MKDICFFSAVTILLLGSATPPPSFSDSNARAQAPSPAGARTAARPAVPAPPAAPRLDYADLTDLQSTPELIRWEQLSESVPAPVAQPQSASGTGWSPGSSVSGPVRVVISLPQQKAFVYRGGALLWTSPVSTGKRGHSTPTGTFRILQKKVKHVSNIYFASMPYMQRLTHSGIALHAGHVPGYRASHGCIRLPWSKAKKLYEVTSHGTTVVVTNERVNQTA